MRASIPLKPAEPDEPLLVAEGSQHADQGRVVGKHVQVVELLFGDEGGGRKQPKCIPRRHR